MRAFGKTITTLITVVALSACAVALTGCNEQVAATYNNDQKILEEDVTTYVTNLRTSYGYDQNETYWTSFIEDKEYDTDAAESDTDSKKTDSKKEESKEKGTVAEYRAYVIEQMIREKLVEKDIQDKNISPSDEDVDAYVEEQRASVEEQYMAGTFESILQQQGYASLDDFKEQARQIVAEEQLREQQTGSTDDEDKWDSYVDGLYEAAGVWIADCPADLSYDPAVIAAKAQTDTTDESTESTETGDAASTDADSSATESGDSTLTLDKDGNVTEN